MHIFKRFAVDIELMQEADCEGIRRLVAQTESSFTALLSALEPFAGTGALALRARETNPEVGRSNLSEPPNNCDHSGIL